MNNVIFILIGSFALAGGYELHIHEPVTRTVPKQVDQPVVAAVVSVEDQHPAVQETVEETVPSIAAQPEPDPVIEQAVAQPVEDRGDAMLFEIDALAETPFDQAVTLPFD